MDENIKEIEKYAKKEDVPIMQKRGINFLCNLIKKNNIKNILEIGTAIGYSSIMMSLVDDDIRITTIERDESRYLEAIKNIKKCNKEYASNYFSCEKAHEWFSLPYFIMSLIGLTDPCCRSTSYTVTKYSDGHRESTY